MLIFFLLCFSRVSSVTHSSSSIVYEISIYYLTYGCMCSYTHHTFTQRFFLIFLVKEEKKKSKFIYFHRQIYLKEKKALKTRSKKKRAKEKCFKIIYAWCWTLFLLLQCVFLFYFCNNFFLFNFATNYALRGAIRHFFWHFLVCSVCRVCYVMSVSPYDFRSANISFVYTHLT